MAKVRVGVAGYGTIGQRLADGVAMQDDMELVGIADLAPTLSLQALRERDMIGANGVEYKLYLVDGLRGKAMRFDDGALRVPCPLERGSVSFTAWLRLDAVENRMPVLSVRCAEDGSGWLCIAATGEDHLVLSVRLLDTDKIRHMEVGLPAKRTGTWLFAAGSFEAEAGVAGFSLNFEPFMRQPLPGKRVMGDGKHARLLLGTDDLSTPGQRFPGVLEDVCVYNKALTDEDMAKLKAYYMG